MILDSGSSYLTLPENLFNEIIWIKFSVDDYCDRSDEIFPILTFRVHEKFFELRPADNIKKPE